MGQHTAIQWTDHTFNPWIGCTKVSPGCAFCYAETLDDRRFSKTLGGATKDAPISHWGKGAPRYRTSEANWREPLKWNREAAISRVIDEAVWKSCGSMEFVGMPERFFSQAECIEGNGNCISEGQLRDFTRDEWARGKHYRPRVFCASLADVFDPEVPIEWRRDLLQLVHRTQNLDWLFLTKRPHLWLDSIKAIFTLSPEENDFAVWLTEWLDCKAPHNVWIGTTVEDQTRAEERIPELLKIPARIRFLSCEPLLGAVDLTSVPPINRNAPCRTNALTGETFWPDSDMDHGPRIHWVICGGESGDKDQSPRPMAYRFARDLRDQCARAGVPFFFKQWGDWIPAGQADLSKIRGVDIRATLNCEEGPFWRVGKDRAGNLLDGVEHQAVPV